MGEEPPLDVSALNDLRSRKIQELKQQQKQELNKRVKFQDSLLIENLLREGVDYLEDFKSENGKLYKIRPVSIPEANEALYRGMKSIAKTETAQKMWDVLDGKTKEMLADLEDEINLLLFTEEESAWLVLFSIYETDKGLYDTLESEGKESAVRKIRKKIPDLGKMAKRVRMISGVLNKNEEEVEELLENGKNAVDSFRSNLKRLGSVIRDSVAKDGTGTEQETDDVPSENVSNVESSIQGEKTATNNQ